MKLEFKKFDKDDFVKEPFEMVAIFGYEDSTYVQGKLIRDKDGNLKMHLLDWDDFEYKYVYKLDLNQIKYYCVLD